MASPRRGPQVDQLSPTIPKSHPLWRACPSQSGVRSSNDVKRPCVKCLRRTSSTSVQPDETVSRSPNAQREVSGCPCSPSRGPLALPSVCLYVYPLSVDLIRSLYRCGLAAFRPLGPLQNSEWAPLGHTFSIAMGPLGIWGGRVRKRGERRVDGRGVVYQETATPRRSQYFLTCQRSPVRPHSSYRPSTHTPQDLLYCGVAAFPSLP